MKNSTKLAAAFAAALIGGQALAALPTLSVANASGSPSTSTSIVVTVTNSTAPDPLIAGFAFRVSIDNARVGFTRTGNNINGIAAPNFPGTQCTFIDGNAFLTCTATAPSGSYTAVSGTVTIPTNVLPAAAVGTFPMNFSNVSYSDEFGNLIAAGMNTGGTFTVSAGPTPVSPTLTYAPAPNAAPATVTFSGGAVGGTGNATITVTPAGAANGGTTSVTGCAVSGVVGTGSFGTPTVTGSPFSGTAGSIGLTCTRAAAVTTGTLTCTETESDGNPAPASRVWGLTCPAGTANTYTSTGSLTFPATLVGSTSAQQNVVVTAAGGNPSSFTIDSCTFGGAQGADFTFGTPAPVFPITVAAGATVNIPVDYTPAAAGASAGTLTCNVTGATTPFVVNLSGTGTAAAANFTANPVSGTAITLPSAQTGQTTSAGVVISNTGNASGTVTCAVTGAGFAVSPTGAQTIGAGANLTFTVSAVSATPTTLNGTLTCTPSVGTPFTYALTAVITQAIVTQIPAFGDFGRWALIGLVAGLGVLVTFRKRG